MKSTDWKYPTKPDTQVKSFPCPHCSKIVLLPKIKKMKAYCPHCGKEL